MLALPIEVKGSWHRDVKRAMKEELSNRYMVHTGAAVGVFVVGYFNAPTLLERKPRWSTIEEAREDLAVQAQTIAEESGGARRIVPIVLDVRLR